MKKKNFLLMLLIMPFVFGACQKDESQSDIVGHWKTTKAEITYLDGTKETPTDSYITDWFIYLESNGTFSWYAFGDDNEAVTGTYTYKNSVITLKAGTETVDIKVVSVTDSQLAIDYGNVGGVSDDVKSIVLYYAKMK